MKSRTSQQNNQVLLYKTLLPQRLSVNIYKAEEGGFWAKVKELPGCRTQGETLSELIEMINDAVYVYLDIPPKLQRTLGFYVPAKAVREAVAGRIRPARASRATLDDVLNHKGISASHIRYLERV